MPPADNTHFLHAATQRRSTEARQRALQAIDAIAASGIEQRVTVVGIARSARVSRSWLYTQPDLIETITDLQNRTTATPPAPPSLSGARQSASQESLQQRLEAAHRRNQQLRDHNTELTTRLEAAYGEIRRLRTATGPQPT